jgi:hypothetical protein
VCLSSGVLFILFGKNLLFLFLFLCYPYFGTFNSHVAFNSFYSGLGDTVMVKILINVISHPIVKYSISQQEISIKIALQEELETLKFIAEIS